MGISMLTDPPLAGRHGFELRTLGEWLVMRIAYSYF